MHIRYKGRSLRRSPHGQPPVPPPSRPSFLFEIRFRVKTLIGNVVPIYQIVHIQVIVSLRRGAGWVSQKISMPEPRRGVAPAYPIRRGRRPLRMYIKYQGPV